MNTQDYLKRLRDDKRWVDGPVAVPRVPQRRSSVRRRLVLIAIPVAAIATVLVLVAITSTAHTDPPRAAAVAWSGTRPATAMILANSQTPRRYPACAASSLRTTTTRGGITMGDYRAMVTLRNASSTTCSLGSDELTIVGTHGNKLAVTRISNGKESSIALAPNSVAKFDLALIATCAQSEIASAAHTPVRLKVPGGLIPLSTLSNVPASASLRCANSFAGTSGLTREAEETDEVAAGGLGLSISLAVPTSVSAGSTLRYVVTLRNRTARVIHLTSCPDYQQLFVTSDAAGKRVSQADIFVLSCSSHAVLRPGSSVHFNMRLLVPKTSARGVAKLTWVLADGAQETMVVRVR